MNLAVVKNKEFTKKSIGDLVTKKNQAVCRENVSLTPNKIFLVFKTVFY